MFHHRILSVYSKLFHRTFVSWEIILEESSDLENRA